MCVKSEEKSDQKTLRKLPQLHCAGVSPCMSPQAKPTPGAIPPEAATVCYPPHAPNPTAELEVVLNRKSALFKGSC